MLRIMPYKQDKLSKIPQFSEKYLPKHDGPFLLSRNAHVGFVKLSRSLRDLLFALPTIKHLSNFCSVAIITKYDFGKILRRLGLHQILINSPEYAKLLETNIFNYSIGLDYSSKSRECAIISNLLSKKSIGFSSVGHYNVSFKFNDKLHIVNNFSRLLSVFGINYSPNSLIRLPTNKKGLTSKYVLIYPFYSKRLSHFSWGKNKFISFSNLLLREFSVDIYFVGREEHRARFLDLIDKIEYKNRIKLFLGIDLDNLISLISNAQLVITGDSFFVPFAICQRTPILALFGPSDPKLFGPYPLSVDNHVYLGKTCSPCVDVCNNKLGGCAENYCMQDIPVGLVYGKVVDLLSKNY